MPFVSELTVTGDAEPDAVWVVPLLLDVQVAVKLVTAEPPSEPAVKATLAELLPRVTVPIVGADGAAAATNELDAVDAGLFPVALAAVTVQVYVLALVSELTVSGDEAPDAVRVVPPSLEVHVTV